MEPIQAVGVVVAAVGVSVALQFFLGVAGSSGESSLVHTRNNLHILRKIQHAATGLVFVLVLETGLSPRLGGLLMLTAAAGFWLLHQARMRFPAVQKMFLLAFASIMREHERTSLPGAAYFLVGCGLLACFASRPIVGAGILAISIGDPIASATGVLYGAAAKQWGMMCSPSPVFPVLPGVQAKLWHRKSLVGCVAGAAASAAAIAAYWGLMSPLQDVHTMLGIVEPVACASTEAVSYPGLWEGVLRAMHACRGGLLSTPWQMVPQAGVHCGTCTTSSTLWVWVCVLAVFGAGVGALAEALEVQPSCGAAQLEDAPPAVEDGDSCAVPSSPSALLEGVAALLGDDNVRVPLAAGAAIAGAAACLG